MPITVEHGSTLHRQTLLATVQTLTQWGFHHREAVVGRKRPGYPVAPPEGK